jgi:hypothetical protein
MLVDVRAQPVMKRVELPGCDLIRDFRMSFDGRSIELRAQNVADGVALESTTDGTLDASKPP